METFEQGYRLKKDDLNISFIGANTAYPSWHNFVYSPFWVKYEVGFIDPRNLQYYRFGPEERVPEVVKIGVFRGNFIIGADWPTGNYEIKWKYRKYQTSNEEQISIAFKVETAGIYDNPYMDRMPYHDLPASFSVI